MPYFRDTKDNTLGTMDAFTCYKSTSNHPSIWLGYKGDEF